MNQVPVTNYRFDDLHYITEFITPTSHDIEDVLLALGNVAGDELVEKVAAYIRDNFTYPLDSAGNPSCDGQFVRYRKNLFPPNYQYKSCKFYIWAFPSEVIQSKMGYCAETGNLAESLLVSKLDAWATLGDVLDLNDMLLGRHEWVEVPYEGESHVLETTIHSPSGANLAKTSSVYDKNSDWAKQARLYYAPQGWFNNREYKGDNVVATTMNLPAKRLYLYKDIEKVRQIKARRLAKELRQEHKILEHLLKQAWGG